MELQEAQPEALQYGAGRVVIGSLVFMSANIALASRANDKASDKTNDKANGDKARFAVDTSFRVAGKPTVAQPTLITTLGQPSGIRVDTELGPVEISLLVTGLP